MRNTLGFLSLALLTASCSVYRNADRDAFDNQAVNQTRASASTTAACQWKVQLKIQRDTQAKAPSLAYVCGSGKTAQTIVGVGH